MGLRDYKGHKETFMGDGYVYYLDGDDGFMTIYICQKLFVYTLKRCSELYVFIP